jgi:DNA-binding response OmpR family regulator
MMNVSRKADCDRARILIIEDEALVAETMREDLEDEGFKVVGLADRLEKALAIVANVEFDVAVVDLNLAGVSAIPIVMHLAQIQRPFLILSGYAREQLSEDLSGVVFLRKPYRLDHLVSQLKKFASGR